VRAAHKTQIINQQFQAASRDICCKLSAAATETSSSNLTADKKRHKFQEVCIEKRLLCGYVYKAETMAVAPGKKLHLKS
jgi:hypothetical protein